MKEGIQASHPINELRDYGCYFFVLLRWAEILRGAEFDDADITQIFEYCKYKGWMEDDCFIVNPVAVLNSCVGINQFSTVRQSKNVPTEELYAVYLKKPGHGHFVLGNRSGILWDSLDPGRLGVKDYRVDSYRIIT